jgi:predicted transcriptional regulator
MSALTIRMPAEKYSRLKQLSAARKVSMNRLVDEMATIMLTEFDAETRFQARVERGIGKQLRGLALLEKTQAAKT